MKLTTNPEHWLDAVLWPVLRLLWEPFFKKRSHFWHWRTYEKQYAYWITAKGDPSAKSRQSRLGQFWQTNFGWEKVVILQPKGNYARYDYRIGFSSVESGQKVKQLCSIVLYGRCAVLVGPDNVSFFAVKEYCDDSFIPLEVIDVAEKKKLPRGITLI